ncbi:MAG: carbon-nitrogen hydrolase family protein [Chloroflexota bacterium]|nr:carbon-nitrogen hydrolase family protein [Chloroflexota bacterium]
MGDSYPKLKAAAVQAAPVFLDREATVEKACRLIHEAADHGAQLIAFPEGFIPAHPNWFHFHPATSRVASALSIDLYKNAVEVPSPQTEALCQAARAAGAYVVVGLCEKLPHTMGTMFNTQLYIGPDGQVLGKHQKTMPTVGERLVHMGGYGDTFGAFNTEFGPASALICGENSNPLAVFALTAEGTRVHVMSWPPHFSPTGQSMRSTVLISAQSFAEVAKAYVISSCGTVDEHMIEMLQVSSADEALLRDEKLIGGSAIVAPDSRVIAGPMGAEEGILYAELDLESAILLKLRQDFAGHYNRPDIFQVRINRTAPLIYAEQQALPERATLKPATSPAPQLVSGDGGMLPPATNAALG